MLDVGCFAYEVGVNDEQPKTLFVSNYYVGGSSSV